RILLDRIAHVATSALVAPLMGYDSERWTCRAWKLFPEHHKRGSMSIASVALRRARLCVASLLIQRHQRIHASGPACRQVTRHQRDCAQYKGGSGKADRVGGPHAVQHPAEETPDQEGCCEA